MTKQPHRIKASTGPTDDFIVFPLIVAQSLAVYPGKPAPDPDLAARIAALAEKLARDQDIEPSEWAHMVPGLYEHVLHALTDDALLHCCDEVDLFSALWNARGWIVRGGYLDELPEVLAGTDQAIRGRIQRGEYVEPPVVELRNALLELVYWLERHPTPAAAATPTAAA